MSIGRVDMQVMLQRAPEVNRVTNNDGSRAETQNQQFTQSLQKAVEQEGKQVVSTNQAEKGNIDKDGRGKGGGKDGGDGKGKDKGKNEGDGKPQIRRSMLDLRG